MRRKQETLSGLAVLLRVRPELQLICRFGAQWSAPHEHVRDGAPFHIVTRGSCLLDVGEHTNLRLDAGDVALLPHGGRHTVRALPGASGISLPMRLQSLQPGHLPVKANIDSEPDTVLLCGRLIFEHAEHNLVLAALPSAVVLKAGEGHDAQRVRAVIETIRQELDDNRLAATAVASGLASALMMIVLRYHVERAHDAPGVLGLLQGRQTARVLAAMVGDFARPWSLDELASEAITSRATLVRLFRKATGLTPMAFLSELRLSVARHRLLATHDSIAAIAGDFGYQSEAAFSRAYQRRFGITPGADR